MPTEQDVKVGISMLEDIDKKLNEKFGIIASPKSKMDGEGKRAFRHVSYPFLEQCKSIMKKVEGSKAGESYTHFIKAWIYGIQADYTRSIEEYNKALELNFGNVARLYYHIAITYDACDKYDESIEYHQKVVDALGVDNDLGMASAKKIEEMREKKKSGCFIATAIMGSELANEVIVLKDFRDNYLKNSTTGRFFIKYYYKLSPPIARFIIVHHSLKSVLRNLFIKPIIKFLNSCINLN